MTMLGLYFLTGVIAASPSASAKPETEKPKSEAILKLDLAIAKLRKGHCDDVFSAKQLLGEAKKAPKAKTESEVEALQKLLKLAEDNLERRDTALGCSAGKADKAAKTADAKKAPEEAPTSPKEEDVLAKPQVRQPKSGKAEIVYADYTRARDLSKSLLKTCPGRKTAENLHCKEQLNLAQQLQTDFAFESLRLLPERDDRWPILRQEITLYLLPEGDAKRLLDAIQERMISEGMSAEEAQSLLDKPREKLDLAEQLADADNNAAIWKIFFESAKETFTPTELATIRRNGAKVDWAVVFAHLTNLSDDKWKILYERMLASGQWIPHHNEVHLRRDEFRLLYVFHDSIKPEEVVEFTDRFSALIQGISPTGARDPEFLSDLPKTRAVQLLTSAQQWMLQPFSCTNLGKGTPTDPFEHRLFCGSYVGILIVEFEAKEAGQVAIASWIRHIQGKELKVQERKRAVTLPSSDEKRLEAFQASAQTLASTLAGEESLFPAIARLIPAAPLTHPSPGPTLPPPPPPPVIEGTAWHAFLFAGLPYLEDSEGGTTIRLIASGLDVATVFSSLAAMRWSIHERNRYSGGNERAFGDANDYLKMSGYLLLGTLTVRSAAAICYWNDRCRQWVRR